METSEVNELLVAVGKRVADIHLSNASYDDKKSAIKTFIESIPKEQMLAVMEILRGLGFPPLQGVDLEDVVNKRVKLSWPTPVRETRTEIEPRSKHRHKRVNG